MPNHVERLTFALCEDNLPLSKQATSHLTEIYVGGRFPESNLSSALNDVTGTVDFLVRR